MTAETPSARPGRPRTADEASRRLHRGSTDGAGHRSFRAFLCPTDPSHGRLLDWPTERWAWYCPHWAHDGFGETPRTRAFFTTDEAEQGVTPTPRSTHEAGDDHLDALALPSVAPTAGGLRGSSGAPRALVRAPFSAGGLAEAGASTSGRASRPLQLTLPAPA